MVSCAARGCKNKQSTTQSKESRVTFHRFPKDQNVLDKWMKAVGVNQVNKWMRLCSDHFTDHSFHEMVPGMKLRRLKPCAIPLQCSYDKDVTSVDCNETAECAASVNQVQNGTDDRHSDVSNVDDCEIIDLCDENPGPSERPVCCHGSCSVETAATNISCQLVTSAFTQTDGRCTFTDSTTSPINHSNLLSVRHVDSGSSSSDSDSDYDPLKDSQGTLSTNYDSQKSDDNVLTQCRAMTNHLACSNSQRYLGLPQQFLFLLDSLAGKLPFSGKSCVLTQTEVVEIVLRKVRLNETFDVLADLYGVSKSHISRLFSRCLPILSMYFKDPIIWPTLTEVQKRLPLAFKTRYRNVISIIDCLEIEIQKPAKALEQSLTWSEYKHANTVKYLISCTPDGTINFVSSGYSGNISDVQLVTESGYLDCLQPGVTVMADRGFKSIDTVLQEKGCRLCKPPSMSKNEKLPNELIREAKVVAALRVHVERVIRRIREYSFLAPHACIPSHLVSLTDYAIVVAAGLVNLQPPLIVA